MSSKATMSLRTRLILWMAASLLAGIALVFLSQVVKPARAAHTSVATAPASAPAAPLPGAPTPTDPAPAPLRRDQGAQGLSNLLLLFGLMCLGVTITTIAWLVVEIRRSRPAWMTQTKYPRRR